MRLGVMGWASLAVAILFHSSALAVSGNEWRMLLEMDKTMYVMGVIDGWDNVRAAKDSTERKNPSLRSESSWIEKAHAWIVTCAVDRKLTPAQMTAITKKYMDAHPESWHYMMSSTVFKALEEFCL